MVVQTHAAFGTHRGVVPNLGTVATRVVPRRKDGTMSEWDEAKGRTKEAVGDLTDDDDLKREGKLDKLAGKAKDAVENVKDKVQDAVDGR
jgi:uncharacterized protein YjbJ (UPF0337 family)